MSTETANTPAPESAPIENEAVETEATSEEPSKEILVAEAKEEQKQEEIKKSNKKKFQLQVNKKSKEIELDLDNEEEVKRYLQKAMASDEKFQEAAQLRKAAEEFINVLRTDPRRILSDPNIGIDVKKLAQDIMNEELEDMNKTPEQKEIEKLRKELESRMESDKKEKETREQQELERLQNEQEEKLSNDIGSALEAGQLPKTPYTVKKMAEMMMIALQNDIDLSAKDVVPLVRKQMMQEVKDLLSSTNDDILEEFLKDQMPRIRKRSVAKSKAPETAASVKPTGTTTEKKDDKDNAKKMTMRQFFGV
jgi:hypothetical protein